MASYLEVTLQEKNGKSQILLLDYSTTLARQLADRVYLVYGELTLLTQELLNEIVYSYQANKDHLLAILAEEQAQHDNYLAMLPQAANIEIYEKIQEDLRYEVQAIYETQEEIKDLESCLEEWRAIQTIYFLNKDKYNLYYLYS